MTLSSLGWIPALPRKGGADMKQSFPKEQQLPCWESRKEALTRWQTPGFTMVEMMVVLTVVAVILVIGGKGFIAYNEEYQFSNAVRELNHAIGLAQVRAIQSQNNAWVLIRPVVSTQNPSWQPGKTYSQGSIVNDGRSTYCCILPHTSSGTSSAGYVSGEMYNPYGNEPGVGGGAPNANLSNCGVSPYNCPWKYYWVEIADYQFNAAMFDIQDWTTGVAVDASPYNATTPVSIQFTWLGVPTDSNNHVLRVTGNKQYAGAVQITVTYMGKILQGPIP